MRVLLISNYCHSGGGISVQVRAISNHLLEDGIESDIFSTKGGVCHRIAVPFALLWKGRKYDVFHIHACSFRGFFPAVVGIVVGRLMKKKIILTYHGGDADAFFARRKRFVKFFLTRTDANVVLSGFHGKVFDKYGLPYVVIPNVADFNSEHFRLRQSVTPKFICIRSHTGTYNIKCILDAFKIVKGQISGATLTLLGDGPLHEDLIRYAEDLDLEDVSFPGLVRNDAIFRYLDGADIMLSSPVVDNMPVSLLEGFSSGLLVISSNVGGVPYMIEDGVNGLLFESGNADALAGRMMYALTHADHVRVMCENAFAAAQTYSWKNVGGQLKNIYYQ